MAIDLNKGIELNQIGAQLKSIFSKDSKVLSNKAVIFIAVSFLLSIYLLYLIYDISGNQLKFDEAQASFNKSSSELSTVEAKLKKTIDLNKVYFDQLANSPKDKSELSAEITALISQYNLKLSSIDLNARIKGKKTGVSLVVAGSYLNLIRFSSEMNEVLAASQLLTLEVTKDRKTSSLIMTLLIDFSSPPAKNTLPKAKPKTLTLDSSINHTLNNFLSIIISSANANEELILPLDKVTELPPLINKVAADSATIDQAQKLSLFQLAFREARSKGWVSFKFTNKAGITNEYLTGLKAAKVIQESSGVVAAQPKNRPAEAQTQIREEVIIEAGITEKAKQLLPKTDSNEFIKAGFVEKNTEIQNQNEEKPSGSLRDPFAPQGSSPSRISSSSPKSDGDQLYFLSGVLTSEMAEFCVVITPLGESKIYRTGDTIKAGMQITGIYDKSITTNGSNKKILIGDEIH